MKTLGVLIVALASATLLAGCFRAESYPQYSGTYHLVSAELQTAKPLKVTKLDNGEPFPETLHVIHRMVWAGHYWQHFLGFWAGGLGDFSSDLSDITRYKGGCKEGDCEFDGVSFRPRKKPLSPSGFEMAYENKNPFCTFYGYDYKVFIPSASMKPDPALLTDVYYDHNDLAVGGGAQVPGSPKGTVPEKIDPKDPPMDHGDGAKWYQAMSDGGAELTIYVSKERSIMVSGCDKDNFLITDRDRDLAKVKLVYRMQIEDADDSTDIRTKGTSGIDSFNTGTPGNFFDRITGFQ